MGRPTWFDYCELRVHYMHDAPLVQHLYRLAHRATASDFLIWYTAESISLQSNQAFIPVQLCGLVGRINRLCIPSVTESKIAMRLKKKKKKKKLGFIPPFKKKKKKKKKKS